MLSGHQQGGLHLPGPGFIRYPRGAGPGATVKAATLSAKALGTHYNLDLATGVMTELTGGDLKVGMQVITDQKMAVK